MKVPSAYFRRAFTLIELLVVISIIAILATILIPTVNNAIYNAQKVKAKNDAVQIANAINAYMSEYGKLPTESSSDLTGTQDQTGDIMDALAPATANSTNKLNPRQITFLEIPKAKSNGTGGRVDGKGPYNDPWGQGYYISMDADYDGSVKGPSGKDQSAEIRQTVIVWSKGDLKRVNDVKDPSKWIKSWE